MSFTKQALPTKDNRVVVGMSGGVDSTLTALLLQEAGCEVIGVTMRLYPTDSSIKPTGKCKDSCYSQDEIYDIKECEDFCSEHKIEYHVIDCSKEYEREVLSKFKQEYRAGRTPNPCVLCNRAVKFGAMLEGVGTLNIDYDYFCTGHYAKVVQYENNISLLYNIEDSQSPFAPFLIAKAQDSLKDQSYFLYRIRPCILKKVRFPLADFTKKQVYAMAQERALKASQRRESQDFMSKEDRAKLFQDISSVPGNFVDENGTVLGVHNGIEHYTVGQRRGLGLSANVPMYVKAINAKANSVVLATEDGLYSRGLIACDFVWAADYAPQKTFTAFAKIRLASASVKATVTPLDCNKYEVIFDTPQRAVACGQSVVFYIENVIVGGGIICDAL